LGVRFAILEVCHTKVKQKATTSTNRNFTGHIPRNFIFGGDILMPVGQYIFYQEGNI
jgi:hypothetical protein